MLSLLGQSPAIGEKNVSLDSNIEFVISSSVSIIDRAQLIGFLGTEDEMLTGK